MFQRIKTIFLFFFIAIVFVSLSSAAEDEDGYSYDPSSPNGPANWGQIRPEWFLCGNGTMQSPVDLTNATDVTQIVSLQTMYRPASATLVDRGDDVSLRWDGNPGYFQIDGTMYNLEQCHWHTPTEHTIESQRYDVEIHCVHVSNTNRTAVISILYKIGAPDPFLTLLTAPLITLANGRKQTSAGIVDPRTIKIASLQHYYRYLGSITIPPCTEDVVWTVFKQIRSVSRAQVKLLQEAAHDEYKLNARPVQPLNNRTLLLYKQL